MNIHLTPTFMKTFLTTFSIAIVLMAISPVVQSQEKVVVPANYKVDTRVDNMGYWRKCAELGLVPVEPYHRIPAPKYTGTLVVADGILVGDSPDVPVTEETSTQSENSIVIDPNNKSYVLNSNNSTPVPAGSIYGANYFHSSDEGETWTGQLQGAGGANSGDPAACINLSGRHFIGFIDNGSGQSISYSDNQGATWTTSKVANAPSGFGNMLDKNHLWVDKSPTSPFKGYVYDAWTTFGGSNDSQIGISYSSNNGVNWSSVTHISQAVNAGSHNQGVNLKTGPDGEVYAAWAIYDSWPSDEKAIGFAKSLDGGLTWEPAVRVINNIKGIRTTEVSPNQRVNSFPSMAVDISNSSHRGDIYIVWPNIGVPGVNSGNGSDVYMIKSSDKGATWSTPVKVNTDATGQGKDHYFPWIACDQSNGMLAIVFYDNRNVNDNMTETWMAYSDNGGATWTDMKVSDVAMTPSPIPGLASGYMGDYLGIDIYNGKVYPGWCDNRSGQVMTYVSPIDLILPAPKLVHDAHQVNDTAYGNGDGVMSYGDTILLGVKIKNIGTLDADNVVVTLKTSSPYITILDTTENYGAIAKGTSKNILAAFKYAVAQNVPNNTDIEFFCEAHDQNDSVTISTFTIKAMAPAPTIISMTVQDPSGNNNGRLDPGETATIHILNKNTGPYTAEDVISTLTSNNPFVTVLDGTYSIGDMIPGQEKTVDYTVTVDPSTYYGSAVVLHDVAQALYQSDTRDFLLPIGLLVEDWETGDFTKFAWEQGGDVNWVIDPTTKWEGNYGSKSGDVSDNQKSELIIHYNVMFDDSISFYRKVSTQVLSDMLKFYIDDLRVAMWSGNQDWKRFAYPVLAGPHTFKWVYEKDAAGSMNDDAVWTDFIVFPPEYKTAVNAGSNATICGNTPYLLHAMAVNYDSIQWTTSGTGTFSDATILNPTYSPSAGDVTTGTVTLTLTAWAQGGIDSTDQVVLTIVPGMTASAGGNASGCSSAAFTPAATAANYESINWTTKGDGTFDNPAILTPAYTPGPADIAAGNVELKLTAHSAVCPVISDSLLLTILPSPAVNLGPDTAICANHTYTLDATTPDATGYLWTPGNLTTPVITVDSVGTGLGVKEVVVVVTAANGCQGTDAIDILFKDCTGMGELQGVTVNMYPNPAKTSVTIELKSATNRELEITILSTRGERILSTRGQQVNGLLKKEIDLSTLAQGNYLVQISDGTGRMITKLIVAR